MPSRRRASSRHFNCLLYARGYGGKNVIIEGLGYGRQVVSEESEARRTKSFYPKLSTSGEWFVEIVFSTWEEYDEFNLWMAGFFNRATDPDRATQLPMTVKVPSRGFIKQGYPTFEIKFGDEFGQVVQRVRMTVTSSSESETDLPTIGSRFTPPLRDAVARRFYPSGVQESGYVAPPYNSSTTGAFIRKIF